MGNFPWKPNLKKNLDRWKHTALPFKDGSPENVSPWWRWRFEFFWKKCVQVKHVLKLRGCNKTAGCRVPLQLRSEPRTSLMVALPSKEMETLMESWSAIQIIAAPKKIEKSPCCGDITNDMVERHNLERHSNKYQRKYSKNVITLPRFNMEPRCDGFQKESPIPGVVIFRFLVILWEGICKHLQHGILWRNKHSHYWHSMKSIEILVSNRDPYTGSEIIPI